MVDEFGEIKREFRPSIGNLYVGFVVGILLFVGGLVLLWFMTNGVIQSGGVLEAQVERDSRDWSWFRVIFAAAIGCTMVYGGVLYARWSFSHVSFQLWVGEKGIAEFTRNSVRVIKWSDIKKVLETFEYASVPKRKGLTRYPLQKGRSLTYIFELNEGEPIVFDGHSIKGHHELGAMIKAETESRGVPWKFL